MLLLLVPTALGATLPGVSVPFETDSQGHLVLGSGLPQPLLDAGAAPGWVLTQVDDTPVADGLSAQLLVADGGARPVRLTVTDPNPAPPAPVPAGAPAPPPPVTSAILVVRRAELVGVHQSELVPWPTGFAAPAGEWHEDFTGAPVITDSTGASWRLDPVAATWTNLEALERPDMVLPSVFWSLSTIAPPFPHRRRRTGLGVS